MSPLVPQALAQKNIASAFASVVPASVVVASVDQTAVDQIEWEDQMHFVAPVAASASVVAVEAATPFAVVADTC